MKEYWSRFKKWLAIGKSCSIDKLFDLVEVRMDTLMDKCSDIERKLDRDINELTTELSFYKGMVDAITESLPDMMWCKDVDGKYVYANKAIKEGLIFNDRPIGMDDIELAMGAKELFGEDEHTFGEKCANSDKVVLAEMRPMRFLESGKIKGKITYLEVFKAPIYIDGKIVGVVGTGRDMTEYVETYRKNDCRKCGIDDVFSKYEFEG